MQSTSPLSELSVRSGPLLQTRKKYLSSAPHAGDQRLFIAGTPKVGVWPAVMVHSAPAPK